MGNRGTNLYLSFKYGKAHRVDGSIMEGIGRVLNIMNLPSLLWLRYTHVFLRNKEITLHPS